MHSCTVGWVCFKYIHSVLTSICIIQFTCVTLIKLKNSYFSGFFFTDCRFTYVLHFTYVACEMLKVNCYSWNMLFYKCYWYCITIYDTFCKSWFTDFVQFSFLTIDVFAKVLYWGCLFFSNSKWLLILNSLHCSASLQLMLWCF